MSRSRDRKRRDVFNSDDIIAKRSLPFSNYNFIPHGVPRLNLYEDGRFFRPERQFYAPAKSLFGYSTRVLDKSRVRSQRLVRRNFRSRVSDYARVSSLSFSHPERVITCIRRAIRGEVLHAFRKTGRRGQRKPRWSWRSYLSCKR